jgi:AAA family ATP:ADP antiporter
MLFFILFNYTILRDTKDVLVITAPNSGAEIIPFLKTYVNLPSAIAFTIMYSNLCNMMSPDKVFYVVMSSFIAFFGAFAGLICKRTLLVLFIVSTSILYYPLSVDVTLYVYVVIV